METTFVERESSPLDGVPHALNSIESLILGATALLTSPPRRSHYVKTSLSELLEAKRPLEAAIEWFAEQDRGKVGGGELRTAAGHLQQLRETIEKVDLFLKADPCFGEIGGGESVLHASNLVMIALENTDEALSTLRAPQ